MQSRSFDEHNAWRPGVLTPDRPHPARREAPATLFRPIGAITVPESILAPDTTRDRRNPGELRADEVGISRSQLP
jgi:hypothetical protein